MNKSISYFSALILGICALSACSILSPVNTGQIHNYLLNSIPPVKTEPHTNNKTLIVLMPEGNPIYNTLEMAYTTYPYQVAYFAHNRWADTPTQMLKTQLIQTLQNTHHFRNVVTLPFAGKYDYVLHTQLLELQQDFSQNPSVLQLKLRAQLLNATGKLILSKDYNICINTEKNTPYSGVIAANKAIEQALSMIAELCLQTK